MPYTAKQMEAICRDPIRLRGYFWHVAMNAKRMAKEHRRQLKHQGKTYSPTGFKEVFDDGRDLHHWAKTLDSFSDAVLDNLDILVQSSLETA